MLIYIYIYMGKTENKFDSKKMYRDEKHTSSSEKDFICRNI